MRLTTCGSITVETSQSETVSKTFAPKSAIRLPRIVQNEIVSFKVGYLCGEPIQYVSRNGGEEIVKQINTLNEYMFAEDKAAQDQRACRVADDLWYSVPSCPSR